MTTRDDPELARELLRVYAAPDEPRYWDALEARIVAAVREATVTTTGAFRAVPAVAVEWWHALARWAQPGLAAAAVALAVAGAVFVEARATAAASRAGSAFRDVLDAPLGAPIAGPGLDAGLARAGDDPAFDDSAAAARERRARVAAELLSGGLARGTLPDEDTGRRGRAAARGVTRDLPRDVPDYTRLPDE